MDGTPTLLTVDLIVVALYLGAVIAIAVWASRRKGGGADYFLAGRMLPWYLIGFSLYASNMSGASFVGLMGASYQHGLVVFNYEWTATLVLVLFAVFMLPVFLRARLYTVPEYLERRFDHRARRIYSAFTILAILFIDTAGALYAGGIVLTLVFPGLGLWAACALLALFAGLYTTIGGLRAVVATDALQAVVIIMGAGLIVVIGLEKVGGWSALFEASGPEHTALLRPADDAFLPWPGIFGVVLLGFYYWTLNQYFVQRALGARSLQDGRKGALFGGLLKLPNLVLMIVPGLIALQLFPELPTPDMVFPKLAFELLPAGLRGLVLVALLAAIMSSLDSAMNAAASLVTMDFVHARRSLSDRAVVAVGRVVTLMIMAGAALYAPLIRDFGSLFEYFQSTLAYLVPPVVAVYLGGLFWRGATAEAAFRALVGGFAVGLPLFVAKELTPVWLVLGLPDLSFLYMAILMFGLSLAILIGASIAASPCPAAAEFCVRRADVLEGWGAGRGRAIGAAIQPALLLVLTIALIVAFA